MLANALTPLVRLLARQAAREALSESHLEREVYCNDKAD